MGDARLSARANASVTMAAMTSSTIKILDFAPDQLREYMKLLGESPYRADQILQCVYRDYATDFEQMTVLNQTLRQKLAEHTRLITLEPLEERTSADGQTKKILFRLEDGKTIESALMTSTDSRTGRERHTVCVSSQVGCPIGCPFCATGQQGFERNLSPGEIIQQVLYFVRRLDGKANKPEKGTTRRWLTNVVFMGMGEPLANYNNVRQAIAMLNSPKGLGLGIHQITLSTSGLVPQIRQLTEEGLQYQLAISLHAANDELRNQLVPINKKYPLEQLVAACKEYGSKTGRNVFIEYALFDKINDSTHDAKSLIKLLYGLKCSINLIPGNTTDSNLQPSSREAALAFQKKLIVSGIRTMLRVSRGADIEAGCGQLRSRWTAANV
ncbi:MAG: 23S rRNA (adenine(2503)-C(2))-methyltransferase RlmN [Dehalococcoidales bacterium]|nr:23S rRNA (adenine(2503)-C(2))-methyltransferase RlmN [Dehalococcoidales bacterium]